MRTTLTALFATTVTTRVTTIMNLLVARGDGGVLLPPQETCEYVEDRLNGLWRVAEVIQLDQGANGEPPKAGLHLNLVGGGGNISHGGGTSANSWRSP